MNCPACKTENSSAAAKCKACGRKLPVEKFNPALHSANAEASRKKPRRPDGAGSRRPPDLKKTEDAKKKAIRVAVGLSGSLLLVAVSLLNNIKDNPIGKFYFIIVAAASMLIPVAQAIVQRRLAAGDYRETLDNLHDALEPVIRRLVEPTESIVHESYSITPHKSALLVLTPNRLMWLDTWIVDDEYEFQKAYMVAINDISSLSYSSFTGKLKVRADGGEVPAFTLTPAKDAAAFAEDFKRMVASSASHHRIKSDTNPIHALCATCGTKISPDKSFCPKHQKTE